MNNILIRLATLLSWGTKCHAYETQPEYGM